MHYGYPDLGIFEEVTEGVTLVGDAPYVCMFDSALKLAKMTIGELKSGASASLETPRLTVRFLRKFKIRLNVVGRPAPAGWINFQMMQW